MPKLGVNIDHIATLRQARREFEPDPVAAIPIVEKAGANSIVCHLREDRRHIQDQDVRRIRAITKKPFNLEMSLAPDIVRFALRVKPDYCMFVPEKRQEVTTEGGLDVVKNIRRIEQAGRQLSKKHILVSLFIDPLKVQIKTAQACGANIVELHTGAYANARTKTKKRQELEKLKKAAQYAASLGLIVHAGHGLKYHDVRPVAKIKEIDELNIGHSIISRAILVGLKQAVQEMKVLVR